MIAVLALTACIEVKQYGKGVEPLAKPVETTQQTVVVEARPEVDWAVYEARLGTLIEDETDADRRERLSLAHSLAGELARGSERHPEEAMAAWMDAMVEVEERAAPQELEGFGDGFRIGGVVYEEDIVEPLDIESARAALASGDYRSALDGLRDHRGETDVDRLWSEAVDGFVHQEREAAGQLFVAARDMPEGEVRDSAYTEVVETLEGLVRDYPESSYTAAIEENLVLVRKALP
ncbi:MAG: hypothetical protein GY913_15195 [Proteobacteria bacterium]|nr:hypothetical protein [Pseudomonadota bacterium]MCP4918255.1 hypothetical protein [Pseudomonadota bacterium]